MDWLENYTAWKTKYLEWKAINAPRAAKVYEPWLDLCFIKVIQKSPEHMTTEDTAKFKRWLEDHPYAPDSIKLAFTALKNFLRFLIMHKVDCMALDLIKIPKSKSNSHNELTLEEYAKMLKALPIQDFTTLSRQVAIRLLFEGGLRVSEVADLNIEDFNPKENYCTIHNRKNQNSRVIVWSQSTHDLIRMRYLPLRQCIRNGSSALLIGFKHKRPTKRITTRSIERWWQEAAKAAGLEKKTTPHSGRHGWAVGRLNSGFDIEFIRKGLGHKHIASTQIYLQRTDTNFVQLAQQAQQVVKDGLDKLSTGLYKDP